MLKSIDWRPDHFALDANKQIARAVERVSATEVVNETNLCVALKGAGKLEQVGGTKYVGELIDSVAFKTIDNAINDVQSWSKQLRGLWEKRCLLAEARSLVATLAIGSVDDHFEAYARSLQRVETLKPNDANPLGCMLSEWGDLNEEPERELWLLVDDATNNPAIALGRTSILDAAGGTGKTTVLMQLTVSVALGWNWCGFRVATPGMVCIACGESDRKLMMRQFWRVMNAMELNPEERAIAASRIVPVPLEGMEVNMIAGDRGNIVRTEFLERFRRECIEHSKVAGQDYSLIVIDPLSRFSGADTEKDNAAATRFIQAVETLVTLPGNPAVIIAHHATKVTPDPRKGSQTSSVHRGVSAIRDGVRSMMGLVSIETEGMNGVYLENDKNNLAPRFTGRWLVQQQGDRGGTLRLASESEAAMFEAAAHPKKKEKPVPILATDRQALQDALLAKIRQLGGSVRSRDWMMLNHMAGWRKTDMILGFKELLELGLITIETNGKNKGTVWLTEQSKQTALGFTPEQVAEA